VVFWHGRWILPFQSYPARPQQLFYSESTDGNAWSNPHPFLQAVLELGWNTDHRAIDPSFVVDGDELHCFFVGSDGLGTPQRANLLGHAVTRDPILEEWNILDIESPLMGRDRAPDGVENVVVYRAGGRWIMMLSEGIEEQHLALAASDDLLVWEPLGRVAIPAQPWCSFRHGAPFVWQEDGRYYMVLMGEENEQHRSTLGFLTSPDGLDWVLCPTTLG
jgi:sucrose-6-phosphate hydrolase SacC (GH32 family)